jgi:hypothetical protein
MERLHPLNFDFNPDPASKKMRFGSGFWIRNLHKIVHFYTFLYNIRVTVLKENLIFFILSGVGHLFVPTYHRSKPAGPGTLLYYGELLCYQLAEPASHLAEYNVRIWQHCLSVSQNVAS